MNYTTISNLPLITARTENDLIPIVQTGTTHSIKVEDLTREPLIDGGDVSGTTSVDLSVGRFFKFRLVDDIAVNFTGNKEGERYVFWVFAVGSNTITSMSVSGGNVYAPGGSLPNPANNKWNLYEAISINGDIVITGQDDFDVI